MVRQILDSLPVGVAVDAACGTGRHTEYLSTLGHRVIGVDSSPEMLARASARVPQSGFVQSDLRKLPLPDDHAGVVVCALALSHLPDRAPVFAESARVLRPGGRLVTSDLHHELAGLGSSPMVRLPGNGPVLLPAYAHRASDYLAAALPLGLQVRHCAEPRMRLGDTDEVMTRAWDVWPWSLFGLVPAAYRAAFAGVPAVVVRHFEKVVSCPPRPA